jgi:hypothetical protein
MTNNIDVLNVNAKIFVGDTIIIKDQVKRITNIGTIITNMGINITEKKRGIIIGRDNTVFDWEGVQVGMCFVDSFDNRKWWVAALPTDHIPQIMSSCPPDGICGGSEFKTIGQAFLKRFPEDDQIPTQVADEDYLD